MKETSPNLKNTLEIRPRRLISLRIDLREFYRKVNVYYTILDESPNFTSPKEDPICLKENAILYQKIRNAFKTTSAQLTAIDDFINT